MRRPVLVMPVHDPEGQMLPHLKAVTPQLKRVFGRAFVSITPQTRDAHAEHITWLEEEAFFRAGFTQPGDPIGKQFLSLYTRAVKSCYPEEILHLAFSDRVAFALQSGYREQFIADVQAVKAEAVPLLFQRSELAWHTHPRNYREIEHIATRVAELVLKRALDLTWCHLAIQARQLGEVLPRVRNTDLSVLAEIVLRLKEKVGTKDVDWLAWEHPFIEARDAEHLRREHESSVKETQKRLSYVIPIIQLLSELAPAG